MAKLSIAKRLARVSSVDDLAEAFRLDHPRFYADPVTAVLSGNYLQFDINGRFVQKATGVDAGTFSRRLEQNEGEFEVYHGNIHVVEAFWDDDIARAHYRKAIRYYVEVLNARRVYMDAEFVGPYAWPAFGFEFEEDVWSKMLDDFEVSFRLLHGGPPNMIPSTARELVSYADVEGNRLGRDAIRRLQGGYGGRLRMILDLRDDKALAFLRRSGILAA